MSSIGIARQLAPLSNLLWVTALVAAVLGTSVLRVFSTEPGPLGPFGSPLFLLLVILAIGHVRHRRQDADMFAIDDGGRLLTFALCAPFLLAVVLEKWVSTSLLDGTYEWIDITTDDWQLADGMYRLWTGLTLAAISLALVLVLRQSWPRLVHVTRLRRLPFAVLVTVAGALVTAAAFGIVVLSTGPLRLGIASLSPQALWVSISAQVTRGFVEELYYRGLLQLSLSRLLVRAGLSYGRTPRVFAILIVSLGFALEHVDPQLGLVDSLRALLFVFFMSLALGVLFETSRNLYLVMLAHAAINLFVGHLIPVPVTEQMIPLLPSQVVVMLFLVVLFAGVTISHRRR